MNFEDYVSNLEQLSLGEGELHENQARTTINAFSRTFKRNAKNAVAAPKDTTAKHGYSDEKIKELQEQRIDNTYRFGPPRWIPKLLAEAHAVRSKKAKQSKLRMVHHLRVHASSECRLPPIGTLEAKMYDKETRNELQKRVKPKQQTTGYKRKRVEQSGSQKQQKRGLTREPEEKKESKDEVQEIQTGSENPGTKKNTENNTKSPQIFKTQKSQGGLETTITVRKSRRKRKEKRYKDFEYYGLHC